MFNSKLNGSASGAYDQANRVGSPYLDSGSLNGAAGNGGGATPFQLYQQQQLAIQSQANNGLYPSQSSYGSQPATASSSSSPSIYGQQQPPPPPQTSQYMASMYGNSQPSVPSPYGTSSTSLFQQQLATQAAANQSAAASPLPSARLTGQQQQQQMMAAMQQRQQQQQANAVSQQRYDTFQNQQPNQTQPSLTSAPPPIPSHHSMYASQAPASLPSVASPSASTPPSTGLNSIHQAQLQERFNSENPISGLTAEKFNALQPHQQLALRQYIAKQRALPQASVGLGFPSGAAPAAVASPTTMNGISSPSMGIAGSPGMGGGVPGSANPAYGASMYQRPNPPAPMGAPNQPNQSLQPTQQQQLLQQQQQQQQAQAQVTSNAFLKTLADFYAQKGVNFPGPPAIEGRVLDLARLYALVMQNGGFQKVYQHGQGLLPAIVSQLGFQADPSTGGHPESRVNAVAQAYHACLYQFEQGYYQRARATQGQMNGAPTPNPSAASHQPQQLPISASTPPSFSQNSPQAFNNAVPPRAASRTGSYGVATSTSAGSPYFATPYQQDQHRQGSPSIPSQGSPNQGGSYPLGTGRMPTPSQQLQNQQQSSQYSSQPTPPPPSMPMPATASDDRKGKGKASTLEKKRSMSQLNQARQDEARSPVHAPTRPSMPLPQSAPQHPTSTSGSSSHPTSTFAMSPPKLPFVAIPANYANSGQGPRSATPHLSTIQEQPVRQAPEEPPAPPPRRKRQKFEYVPLSRSVETFASWDLSQVEEMIQGVAHRKRPRTAHDLGNVDVHSLTMSLKSRLGAEVAFALNSLTLLSLAMRVGPPDAPGLAFPLSACGDLLDELVDLLEETAFGVSEDAWGIDEKEKDDDDERAAPELDSEELLNDSTSSSTSSPPLLTYRDLFRLVVEEEAELLEKPVSALDRAAQLSADGMCPLGPVETISSITNLIRNFSLAEDNAKLMSTETRVVEVLARVAHLPLRRDTPAGEGSWPIRVSAAESLALKKDALETLTNVGLDVRLTELPLPTSTLVFQLLLFFLLDSDHQDQLYFELAHSPSACSRIPQGSHHRLSHYVDLGLAGFARISLKDANRAVLAQVGPQFDLFRLFESLVHLLPVTEGDFQLVTSEPGLVFAENLAMSLYNLAFFSPPQLKLRLRVVPSFVKGFVRVVRRLVGTTSDPAENPFVTLCDRCISTLEILSDVGGIGISGKTSQDVDSPWFGMSMNGEEEDRPTSCVPTEADRGSVKARKPPSSGEGDSMGQAVLSSDVRSVFEMLTSGSGATVFRKLKGIAGL